MNNIYIVGAGQLGSRHLQALKKVDAQLKITVIDPNKNSLKMAETRYNEISDCKYEHEINFCDNMEPDKENIDIAIIATNSKMRRKAVEKLIATSSVKYLILEKLLFDNIDDLQYVDHLIAKNKIKAWVNCPMRMMPFYKQLRSEISLPIHYELSGVAYGLVTNIIHYIDYMMYLTECKDFNLDLSMLNKKIIKSKREGYFELTGSMIVKFKDGSTGVFTCYNDGSVGTMSQITSKHKRVIIDEINGTAYTSVEGSLLEIESIRIPYQSEMTKELIETILDTGDCLLPHYSVSANAHRIIMKEIMFFLEDNDEYDSKEFLFT